MKEEDAHELACCLFGGELEFYSLSLHDRLRILECAMRYPKNESHLAVEFLVMYKEFLDNNKDRDI